jgi:hypothetical protein
MTKILLSGFILLQIALFGCAVANADDLNREQRIAESPQWNGEKFQNLEVVPAVEWGPSLKMFWNYFFNKPEGFIPGPHCQRSHLIFSSGMDSETCNSPGWGTQRSLLKWMTK